MRDLLERLKLERGIAIALFAGALLCIGVLQLLAPAPPAAILDEAESIPPAGATQ